MTVQVTEPVRCPWCGAKTTAVLLPRDVIVFEPTGLVFCVQPCACGEALLSIVLCGYCGGRHPTPNLETLAGLVAS